MKTTFGSLFCLLCIIVLTPSHAFGARDGELITHQRPAREYHPYTIRDLIEFGILDPEAAFQPANQVLDQTIVITEPVYEYSNAPTQITYLNEQGQEVTTSIKPTKYLSDQNLGLTTAVKYEGSVRKYLDEMNKTEKRIAALGYSLHDMNRDIKGEVMEIYERYTDPLKIKNQILASLKWPQTEYLTQFILPPIEPCPLITVEQVLNAVPGLRPDDRVPLQDGKLHSIEEFVLQVQNHQQVFCSVGKVLLDLLNVTLDANWFQGIVDQERALLRAMGVSEFVRGLGFPEYKKIKSYAEAARDIADLIEKKEFPGPEKLKEISDKLGVKVPDQYKIPDLPNIPQATLADRSGLNLKKRKSWSGLNFGSQDRVGTYASAYYELRGSETAQAAQAMGNAGVYLLGRRGDLINGTADFHAGRDEVSARMVINVIGLKIDPIIDFRGKTYQKEDPEAGRFDFPEVSTTIPFSIGPVPGYLTLGARGTIGFSYKIQLAYLRMYGQATPFANASGYARGGVGLAGVMSLGADAQLTIIKVSFPLTGEATVRFEEAGIPFLRLDIAGELDVNSLDGRVDGFVEYPWPEVRFCGPKYFRYPCDFSLGTKKENMLIYKWNGIHEQHRFLSWGMDLSPSGIKLRGDFVDQADRAEAAGLQDKILLDERNNALATYEDKVNARLRTVLNNINNDFSSGRDQNMDQLTADQQAIYEYNRQETFQLIDELYSF